MNLFTDYMDGIRAEDSLKTDTKANVNSILNNGGRYTNVLNNSKKPKARRAALAISAMAACAVLTVAGYAFYNTPVNYVSLDINPSVELGINAFDNIVSAEGYNEDGESILKDNNVRNLSVEDAISILIQKANEQGFILSDGSTVIAVTAESDDENEASDLEDASQNGVTMALEKCSASAIVYADCSSLELRTEAKQLGVSPGKYKLIAALQALDPSITVEQYKNSKITDIVADAGEYLSSASDADDAEDLDEDSTDKIEQAAQKIKAAKENAEKNKNGGQSENETPDESESTEQSDISDTQSAEQVMNQINEKDKNQSHDITNPVKAQKQTQEQLEEQAQEQLQEQSEEQAQEQLQEQSEEQTQEEAQEQTQKQNSDKSDKAASEKSGGAAGGKNKS